MVIQVGCSTSNGRPRTGPFWATILQRKGPRTAAVREIVVDWRGRRSDDLNRPALPAAVRYSTPCLAQRSVRTLLLVPLLSLSDAGGRRRLVPAANDDAALHHERRSLSFCLASDIETRSRYMCAARGSAVFAQGDLGKNADRLEVWSSATRSATSPIAPSTRQGLVAWPSTWWLEFIANCEAVTRSIGLHCHLQR